MDNLLTSHAATAHSAIIVGFYGAHSKRLSLSLSHVENKTKGKEIRFLHGKSQIHQHHTTYRV